MMSSVTRRKQTGRGDVRTSKGSEARSMVVCAEHTVPVRGGAANAGEGRWNPRVTMRKVDCRVQTRSRKSSE